MDITVIGIDPGSLRTGWGIVCEKSGVLNYIEAGVIKTKGEDFSLRIGQIYKELSFIINGYKLKEAAIENIFYGKSITSALKLGQARGASIAACVGAELSVFDYEPRKIKQAIVGVGSAEKSQVAFMVSKLLNTKLSWEEDASDALAVAICHLNSRRLLRLTC